MSVRTNFINKVFGGHKDPLSRIQLGDGAPSHATPRVGVLYWDDTNDDGYIATKTDGSGWVKINV